MSRKNGETWGIPVVHKFSISPMRRLRIRLTGAHGALFLAALLCGSLQLFAKEEHSGAPINLASDSLTFCMSGNCDPLPNTSLFSDPVNNSIGNACIHHVRITHLRVPDRDSHLNALIKGNAITVRNGSCTLTFPVIVGAQRKRLQEISRRGSLALQPKVRTLIERLQAAVPDRPELAFHLLWSRVMDDVWDKAWHGSFGKAPLPDVTWSLSPQLPSSVGTYFYPLPGDGELALTQGPSSWKYKQKVISLSGDLHLLAWGRKIPAQDEAPLRELGMLNSDGKFQVLAYRKGDQFDQLLQDLIVEYAAGLASVYDYKALAKSFGVPPAHMFCIVLHETAYTLLDDLERSGDLHSPQVLTDGDAKDVVELVSIKMVNLE